MYQTTLTHHSGLLLAVFDDYIGPLLNRKTKNILKVGHDNAAIFDVNNNIATGSESNIVG